MGLSTLFLRLPGAEGLGMRSSGTGDRALRGQLVFAEMRAGTLTLDCLLALEGRVSGSPVTFSARFADGGPTSLDRAVELLLEWAHEATPVEVLVSEGRASPQVRITSDSKRVVLTSKPRPDSA